MSIPPAKVTDTSAELDAGTGPQLPLDDVVQDTWGPRASVPLERYAQVGGWETSISFGPDKTPIQNRFQITRDGMAQLEVQSGDNLANVARLALALKDPTYPGIGGPYTPELHRTIRQIADLNGLKTTDIIRPGQILQIFRQSDTPAVPMAGHPEIIQRGASPKFAQQVTNAWMNDIPVPLRDTLLKAGIKIAVNGDLRNLSPDLALTHASGYANDITRATLPAMYLPSRVPGEAGTLVLNERILLPATGSFRPFSELGSAGMAMNPRMMVAHEAMHALDEVLGNFSGSAPMKEALIRNIAGLRGSPELNSMPLSYFLQGVNWNSTAPGGISIDNDAGLKELFSEMASRAMNLPSNLTDNTKMERFKDVYALVLQRLADSNIITRDRMMQERAALRIS